MGAFPGVSFLRLLQRLIWPGFAFAMAALVSAVSKFISYLSLAWTTAKGHMWACF
jgi:hypothetical protein